MCGVFAYASAGGVPDPATFRDAAAGASCETVGSHGWWALGVGLQQDPSALDPADLVPAPLVLAASGAGLTVTLSGHVVVHSGGFHRLADEYERNRQSMRPAVAMDAALEAASMADGAAIILDLEGRLLAGRHRAPLYALADSSGSYLSTARLANSMELPDREVFDLGTTNRRKR